MNKYMLHKISRLLKVLTLMSLLFSGCSKHEYKDYLNLHIDSEPNTLDPALMTDVRSGRLSALLYDTLIRYDENLKIQPCLAVSWKMSDNGLKYIFELRKDVLFSNGQLMTADDVIYSFQRLANPKTASPRAWILEHVEGYEEYRNGQNSILSGIHKTGDYTVEILLNRPFAPFLSLLTMPNASILSQKNDLSPSLSGSGPYILKEWRHDFELVLDRNGKYFGNAPQVPGIRFRIIKETLFVSAEFRRGRLDMIELPGPEISLYINDPKWKDHITAQQNLSLYYLGFNCKKAPFSDKNLRLAVAQSLDVESILKTLRLYRSIPVSGPIPPGVFGYQETMTKYENKNPPSLPDIPPLKLLQSSNEDTLELSETIQAQLKKTGLNINIVEQEWSAFKLSLINGDFDLFLASWWADYPDGENFLFPLFHTSNQGGGGNYTGYSNIEVDHHIEAASHETDELKRNAVYKEIQDKIASDCPMVFLYSSQSQIVKQPWIKGLTLHPLYNGNKMLSVRKEMN